MTLWWAWWEESLTRQIINFNTDPVLLTQQSFKPADLLINLRHQHLTNTTTLHIILGRGDTTQNTHISRTQQDTTTTTTRTCTESNKLNISKQSHEHLRIRSHESLHHPALTVRYRSSSGHHNTIMQHHKLWISNHIIWTVLARVPNSAAG